MKTAIIKRLQRAIMTRNIPDSELETFAREMEQYALIPSASNGLKRTVEPVRIEAIATPHYNTTRWFETKKYIDDVKQYNLGPGDSITFKDFTTNDIVKIQSLATLPNCGQQGEETMDTNYEARNRLNGRLRDAYAEKLAEARKTFFIDSDPVPKTGQELIDRITSGKYTYDKDQETKILERDGQWCHSFLDFIEWRDPANKADRPGFEAWEEKLDKAFNNARDEIVVKDPKDGLETLRAFQALVIS